MAPHSSVLAGKSHGLRSLVGYSPWGRKESETTERLHFHFQSSNKYVSNQNNVNGLNWQVKNRELL